MNFEIVNDRIMLTREIKTNKQTVIATETYGFEYKIVSSEVEKEIKVNEEANIFFEWQRFNIDQEEYQKDEEKNDLIQVEIVKDDEVLETEELEPEEELEFSAEEEGEYIIRTANSKVDNAEVKVVVSDG